jgi:nucleotide-binding universal stress UspA family protein
MDEDGRPVVVVGVDGSRDADAALRHAVREAHRRHGRVLAAAAADSPLIGHRGGGAVHGRPTGPVALGCILRSRCPVTVVPQGEEDR